MRSLSRREFFKASLRAGGVASVIWLAGACSPAPAPEPPPAASPAPLATDTPASSPTLPPTATLPVIAREDMVLQGVAEVTQVAQLTGVGAINDTPGRWGLYGTDLGSMFDKDGKVYMVFGDSFGCCIPGTGGPGNATDWRKNCMAVISDRDPSNGLTFDDMITDRPGHAKELLPRGKFDKTVIPTYGVAIGKRMFLHYMAVMTWGKPGEWLLNESGLAYSDDDGYTWTKDPDVKWSAESNFGQVALVQHEGYLYLFGIPGGRFGGVKLARVTQDDVLDQGAYRYFAGIVDSVPQWSPDERASVLIAGRPVGELSILWNAYLQRWIMTYLDESRGAIVIREGLALWGPWSAPLPVVSSMQFPALYGAYMHPWYAENDGETIYFTMSQWGPYNVFWMKARLTKR